MREPLPRKVLPAHACPLRGHIQKAMGREGICMFISSSVIQLLVPSPTVSTQRERLRSVGAPHGWAFVSGTRPSRLSSLACHFIAFSHVTHFDKTQRGGSLATAAPLSFHAPGSAGIFRSSGAAQPRTEPILPLPQAQP